MIESGCAGVVDGSNWVTQELSTSKALQALSQPLQVPWTSGDSQGAEQKQRPGIRDVGDGFLHEIDTIFREQFRDQRSRNFECNPPGSPTGKPIESNLGTFEQ